MTTIPTEQGAPAPLTAATMAPELEKKQSDVSRDAANDAADSVSTRSSEDGKRFQKIRENGVSERCWSVISFTPSRCKWDLEYPPRFSMGPNILFSFVRLPLSS